MSVSISDAHGGCGRTHSRPVEFGAPVKIWSLHCPQCEDHLRHDPLWSSTLSKIPETYDEVANREELEKSQAREQQGIMVQALAVLAGNVQRPEGPKAPCPNGHLNEATAKFCVECGAPVARGGVAVCNAGHESPATAKFCVECGAPLQAIPSRVVIQPVNEPLEPRPEPHEPEVPRSAPKAPPRAPAAPKYVELPSNTKMRGMKREELVTLAADAGLDPSGNRADLLERLIAYSNAAKAAA